MYNSNERADKCTQRREEQILEHLNRLRVSLANTFEFDERDLLAYAMRYLADRDASVRRGRPCLRLRILSAACAYFALCRR